jgi:hypothetical protein
MRKYLFNGSLISAAFGIIGVLRSTKNGPRDWRLVLSWVVTLASLASAVGDIRESTRAPEPSDGKSKTKKVKAKISMPK